MRSLLSALVPIKLVLVDADTGKPLTTPDDRRGTVTVEKDHKDRKVFVAHKSQSMRGSVRGINYFPDDAKKHSQDVHPQKKADSIVESKSDRGRNKKEQTMEKANDSANGRDLAKMGPGEKAKESKNEGAETKRVHLSVHVHQELKLIPRQNVQSAEFSAEEDEKLKEMKAANKTWREIAAEMKRPQNALKNRFKEIKQDGNEGAAEAKKPEDSKSHASSKQPKPREETKKETKKEDKNEGKKSAIEKKPESKPAHRKPADDHHKGSNDKEGKHKHRDNHDSHRSRDNHESRIDHGESGKHDKHAKRDKHSTEHPTPKPSGSPPKHSSRSSIAATLRSSSSTEPRFTLNQWRYLHEDDMFSFGELQCLCEIALRDENQRWLRIASIFRDKTGRAIHPEDIRAKFAEMDTVTR
jgi:hypothetical protein